MRRWLRIVIAAGGLLPLSACFPTSNPVTTYRDFREVVRSDGGDLDLPDVSIIINAGGDDAIDVYSEGTQDRSVYIAEGVADRLGEGLPFAEPDDFDEKVVSVQLGRRLIQRVGDRWELRIDANELREVAAGADYDGFNLLVCHPAVAASFTASRPPDFDACFNGAGWIVDERPLTVGILLSPDDSKYLAYAAGVLLGVVLFSALAWFVGSKLREGPFRRRTASAVALGLIAGGVVAAGSASTIGLIGVDFGPSDNLALAKDLAAGPYALSALIPALLATIPGLIFMILLVKRRPWPDELALEQRPWPVPPPPPGGPGAPPPPPITWGSR